jgi:hypothetical protein
MSRSISRTAVSAVAASLIVAVAITTPASAHHAGGIGNALGAGPIITDPASTLDEGHSVVFFHQDKTELAVLFGLKTPTGRTNDLTQQRNVFDAEFQPGSGS